jgi:hypothetical protein
LNDSKSQAGSVSALIQPDATLKYFRSGNGRYAPSVILDGNRYASRTRGCRDADARSRVSRGVLKKIAQDLGKISPVKRNKK